MRIGYGIGMGRPSGVGATAISQMASIAWDARWIASDSAREDSANAASGAQIDRWTSIDGSARVASQDTDTNQPTLRTADVDGNSSLHFDRTAACNMSIAAGAGWPGATEVSHTLIAFLNILSTDTDQRFLDSNGSGRLIFSLTTSVAQYGFFDGSFKSCGVATVTGWQELRWSMNAAANTGSIFRNGTQLGSALVWAAASQVPLSGSLRLGSDQAIPAVSRSSNVYLAEICYIARILTADEIATVSSYRSARYPSI